MPGTLITSVTRSGPSTATTAPSARYFVAGVTERGPIDTPVALRSLTDYAAIYGNRVSYGSLYDDLRTHFEEGGVEACVIRVVGAAATAGQLSLMDGAGTATLTLSAANPGAWSAQLSAQVLAGSKTGLFTVRVLLNQQVVEEYLDLASPAAAAAAMANSAYVDAVDAGSASVAPANNPAVVAATLFAAGTDDLSSVVGATCVAALAKFDDSYGTGVVAIPGQSATAVGAGLMAHAKTHNRIAITAVAPGSTIVDAKAAAAGLTPLAGLPGGEFGGLFFPAIQIPDNGITRTITPEGFVAAKRAQAILAVGGPWQSGAGWFGAARFAIGVDVVIDQAAGNDLDNARVSAIRMIQKRPRVYGYRALTTDTANWPSLKERDVTNFVTSLCSASLENYVQRTIDGKGQMVSQLHAELIGIVSPIADAGGLYPGYNADGTVADPGYSVDTGAGVNTALVIAANTVKAVLAIRVAPTAATVVLNIIKAAISASV